ncbi:MAG: sigma-70 family RNA polymerase sigma factor [Pirellulaceae bacterium]|nr:sigma-70 family RNA polymerase sigma factor [Pirellulaceae bacterium]
MSTSMSYSEQVRRCAVCIAESGTAGLSGLYDLTAMRLLRLAVTITRNQHDAEDAVAAALLRVVGDCHLLVRAEHPWAYLLRMVRNEALVILRRKKRWSFIDNITDLLTRRTVDHLEQEDTHRAIWLALRNLPSLQSEVVVLKIWDDMTFVEIAEILGVPAATAASRYRYALEKLADQLRGHQGEVTHE